ncbi:UDP-N-acetylmuramoyl-L-alanyl-D-glutamate--2,6-diaminopimelate ligase [Acetobacter oeni]|uniref:UDP-N-acetylmuramoyl-L-alanyl-D-glutamate--2,6-diaminopimelate ligase n=1 Tax=Acetobacter oeni TaxID=304077 RepID=A0A511XI06_9PROT|nr:UDP-N-acetylmuramoyl-L-alanyl-D-glutamate--2,6-diaminopimelate ligase [Acetobacter oeni]MBB3882512.1 UDP-N-acetylmuramoyl-L-alanyl-D-glutamate--2,6-diaminopimelate ligase [Acetobacter oeni]NHO18676.1 UDP-N-acetylmuramoyl-L-alanyl-D-glutamate--2,6-diaminopimelate ligase [Acetobacter oeni]GBR11821.1 UDP-N-acetylmuramoylalanyl-D-glutamate--2, 6-diaminopimelate ligase [Acetobacter oeni LMG 21952]GEN62551.1 UDP-N-acetylmuramoyl-L-alanyl-D-glutamate--2,6-diaminopimelate ligase [Acetobacter oeni]
MKLSVLLSACGLSLAAELRDPDISGVTADSRAVSPGMLFVAVPGAKQDGRAFIPVAVKAGAEALLVPEGTKPFDDVPQIEVAEPRRVLALMAAALAGPQPERIVAVTGTNGKTSTVDFLRQIQAGTGRAAASFGTLGLIAPVDLPFEIPALTTPDPVTLARGLAALREAGVTDVALEASSHGLDQRRLDGVRITAAGFTNLTRDHLDYHGDIETYRLAKMRLFDTLLPEGGVAAANADMDRDTLEMLSAVARERNLELRLVGEKGDAIRLVAQKFLPEGQQLMLEAWGKPFDVTIALPGRFQADNVMLAAALATVDCDGIDEVMARLPHLRGVRGRMERAALLPSGAAVYVDYAHTPDALARVLDSLRPHAKGRLIVVFGAGGDRDRGKRPLMAHEAALRADVVIVTDDNPRNEDAAAIRKDVLEGAPDATEIGDRRAAIAAGLEMLEAGDVLLVAGKGHEQGQTVAGVVHPFDDVGVVQSLVASR